MKKFGRRDVLAASAGAVLAPAAIASRATAQGAFPDRPVRLIVPAGAGGPTDVVARLLQPQLSQLLGQTVIVENKAGASGGIGTAGVATASPDGYTLLLAPSTNAVFPAIYGKSLSYDAEKAFTGISYVASVPLIIVAPADGAKDLKQLIAMLREAPEKYSYASSGNGGIIHMAGFLFAEKVGAKALHVPYRGSAPGLIDTVAGRHAYQIDTLGSSKGFIDAGKLRVLAVAADKRIAPLPDVPTVEEVTGFKFSIDTWYVAQAPAGTPRPVVEKLNAAFNKALAASEVTKRMGELAISPVQSTPEEATKYFNSQLAFWDPIVRASGAKPE